MLMLPSLQWTGMGRKLSIKHPLQLWLSTVMLLLPIRTSTSFHSRKPLMFLMLIIIIVLNTKKKKTDEYIRQDMKLWVCFSSKLLLLLYSLFLTFLVFFITTTSRPSNRKQLLRYLNKLSMESSSIQLWYNLYTISSSIRVNGLAGK